MIGKTTLHYKIIETPIRYTELVAVSQLKNPESKFRMPKGKNDR